MTYQGKATVSDKRLYPELQKQHCANPVSGSASATSLSSAGTTARTISDTRARGRPRNRGAISRSIYAALQGGAIMHGWKNDNHVMIACCPDGTRPVIFKIEAIDIKD